MFRRHPEKISGLVQTILRDNGLETPLLQHRIVNAWEEVAGPLAARYTTEKRIVNQTLWVSVQNPALRSELSMMKSVLIQQLNAKVGAQIIYDLRIN